MLAMVQKPGPGVEHLAQLDGGDPAQRDAGRWAGPRGRGGRRRCWTMVMRVLLRAGGRAAWSSRWVSAVSWRNISSSPVPSAGRSSRTGTPAAKRDVRRPGRRRPGPAGRRSRRTTSVTPAAARAAAKTSRFGRCARRSRRRRAGRTWRPGRRSGRCRSRRGRRRHLDLVEQVGGEQHGAAAVGEVAEQSAHPPDAGRVEPVGRLVEDQHLRVADQRRREAEPLPHAQGVVAHAPRRLRRGQADEVEHLVDPAAAGP